MAPKRSLKERLAAGEDVLAAEGYLFEFERRGYLQAGAFVPEVVLEHPELVEQLHEEFVHAGSDVVLAFTYYGHREKLRVIGREHELEPLNKKALQIAKKVADRHNCLMAGNICNTTLYNPKDQHTFDQVRAMYKEQVEWATQGGADFVLAETINYVGEAELALEAIRKYGNGMPAVICFGQLPESVTHDGHSHAEACKILESKGADIVGLNCSSGPKRHIEEMKKIRKECKGQLASLPVPYRTDKTHTTFQMLINPETGKQAFPGDLDYFCCAKSEIHDFGKAMKEIGVHYVGLCCGNSSRYFRELAEAMGRHPPASRYSANMDLHYVFGKQAREHNVEIKNMYLGKDQKH